MGTKSLAAAVPEPLDVPTDRLYRIPLTVYHAMIGHGLLTKRDKVVLLDGLLVKKTTRTPLDVAVRHLTRDALAGAVPGGWYVTQGDPVALPVGPTGHDSEPQPDVSVIRGAARDYLARRPGPGDVALVVEVAGGSPLGSRAGLTRYAWARIPVAWSVGPTGRTVEVHSLPTGPADPASYREVVVYPAGQEVPVVVDGREVGRVAVNDLLP